MKCIVNANIYVERDAFAQAMLIDPTGRIVCVGDEAFVRSQMPAETTIVDAHGKTIVPGFNDSHLHLLMSGANLCELDLKTADSIETLVRLGRDYLERHQPPAGTVIHGFGWNQERFDDRRMPTRDDLDRISTTHPIVFERTCCHIAVCNGLALEMAGIAASTPDPRGGRIDRVDGRPTGILRENALDRVRQLYQTLDVETKARRLEAAMRHAASFGITSVQSCDLYGNDWKSTWDAFDRVLAKRPPVRVYHQFHFVEPALLDDFFARGLAMGSGNDFNRVGPLKLFVDGSLGARTALLRSPYRDDPSTSGVATLSDEALKALIRKAAQRQTGVIVHAIGDGAVEMTLDAFEQTDPSGINPLRNGIVHVQITDTRQLQRLRERHLFAYVQPIFLDADIGIVADRVGTELASTSYAFGTLIRSGVPTSFGTDSPIESMNPFENMYCATTRRPLNATEGPAFVPKERIDLFAALDAYTIEGARASFEELRKGRLKAGYVADFAVLDRNIFALEPEQWRRTRVLLTVLAGRATYRSSDCGQDFFRFNDESLCGIG